jgi:hypothetical protein
MDATDVSPSGDGVGPDRDGPAPTETAKQMATAAGATVKQEMASFASAAQDKVQTVADEQRTAAAKAIGGFATAIQHAGEELADNDQTMAGQLIKQAADRLGDLAHAVSDTRPDEMLRGLRNFSRSNPVAFAACSALAGFAIARLVRSGVEPLAPAQPDMAPGAGAQQPSQSYAVTAPPGPSAGAPAAGLSPGQSQYASTPSPDLYAAPDRSSGVGATAPGPDALSLRGGGDDDLI